MNKNDECADLLPLRAEAERILLGSLIIDAAMLRELRGLPECLFADERHRIIHSAIEALSFRNEDVDLITLHDYLRDNGTATAAGGPAYLVEIVSVVRYSAAARECAEILTILTDEHTSSNSVWPARLAAARSMWSLMQAHTDAAAEERAKQLTSYQNAARPDPVFTAKVQKWKQRIERERAMPGGYTS